ncbi:hypothetical protein STIAU_4993, partial [Stigmatella aurantiaca DW4/3-1]
GVVVRHVLDGFFSPGARSPILFQHGRAVSR